MTCRGQIGAAGNWAPQLLLKCGTHARHIRAEALRLVQLQRHEFFLVQLLKVPSIPLHRIHILLWACDTHASHTNDGAPQRMMARRLLRTMHRQ